jgi:predicted O-methyltransferase YrrM
MTQKIILDKNIIKNESLDNFKKYNELNDSEFFGKCGKEHYKLLSYLSKQFDNSIIIDIGTFRGASAAALSSNKTNSVISFDINNSRFQQLNSIENIKFNIDDVLNPNVLKKHENLILNSSLIFLDIDPHIGKEEYKFLLFLKEKNYKGLLILDDIWYFKSMRDNLWFLIPSENKCDITDIGHWSGTGLVYFDSCKFDIEYTKKLNKTDKWTLVTGYFDLTVCSDASASIKGRPDTHYLDTANATMAVEQNLVVFCENERIRDILESKRPFHLKSKTKYYLLSFEDFPLTKYRGKINRNRQEHPYHFDDRNTASYYLLCMARYEMLKRIMNENPFDSTHFAWINICIERMGYKNIQRLNEGLSLYRNKFSTCYIDYIPKSLVDNLPEYYQWGRCSMCSGFFTGNKEYMMKFCNAMEKKFLEVLELGYGHADEQLFSIIYFEQPELFEFYFGDYFQMISNYAEIYDAIESPINIFISRSFQNGRIDLCNLACQKVWYSYKNELCDIDNETLCRFIMIYNQISVLCNDVTNGKALFDEFQKIKGLTY